MLWAFRTAARNTHRLDNHRANQVVYTSTHDTNTAAGWFDDLKPAERAATELDPADPSWSLIELGLGSRASLAVIPAQDVLGLGGEARMNRPGHPHGNWSWRLKPGQLTPALAERLRAATARHRRLPA